MVLGGLSGIGGTEGDFVGLEGGLRGWGPSPGPSGDEGLSAGGKPPPPYPKSPLTHGLDPLGPALLAYNDAPMSPRDWTGLMRPGVSHKREDPSTVGRFGLGFTSVYHLTGKEALGASTGIELGTWFVLEALNYGCWGVLGGTEGVKSGGL